MALPGLTRDSKRRATLAHRLDENKGSTAHGGASAADWLWLALCAAASSYWCVSAAGELGPTFDEPLYVARGFDAWRSGSHAGLLRLGTMPLPADVQTLPLYLAERWRGFPFDVAADLDQLLPWARAVTLCFWWLLLGYGWLTARALAGRWGARLAVLLLACEPNLLAHASLATTDVAVSACLLALVYHFHAGREAPWRRRVGVPSLWFAAAVLAKASALVLGPLCLLAVELERLWHTRAPVDAAAPFDKCILSEAEGLRVSGKSPLGLIPPPLVLSPSTALRMHLSKHALPENLRRFGCELAAITVGGLLLVFIACGSDWRREPSFVAWADDLPQEALVRPSMVWLADQLPIFSNAGEALVRQIKHNVRGNGAFLLGQEHDRAFWYYFPVLLTIKLGEGLLLAPVAVVLLRPNALGNAALAAAAAVALYSFTFRVQLGVRMVLPLVTLYVVGMAAALVCCARDGQGGRRRVAVAVVAVIAVWNVSAALIAWPHGLAYVNHFWGGTAAGYRLVSDSNYDWGQGVKELVRWQQQQHAPEVALWYFGTDPAARRPPLRLLPLHAMPIASGDDVLAAVGGCRLAVSTTLLYGTRVNEAHRRAAEFLRRQTPIDRTLTFLIYDVCALAASSGPNR